MICGYEYYSQDRGISNSKGLRTRPEELGPLYPQSIACLFPDVGNSSVNFAPLAPFYRSSAG